MAKTKKGAEPKTKESKASAGGSAKDAKGEKESGSPLKRKLGLRGAAPWAARHAAKHAAEARARAAEPPLPGSARATIRVPVGAEDIKQRISDLHNSLIQVKSLRKNVNKTFYDIGVILRDVQARRLYEAKGYGSFEAFLEREIDLGKTVSIRLVRITGTFLKEACLEHGMERIMNALISLEAAAEGVPADQPRASAGKLPTPPISASALPLRPPGK